MFRLRPFVVVCLLMGAASAIGWSLSTARGAPLQPIQISVADIDSGKVVIIGRLGIPLKTMATVRGTWRYEKAAQPTKDGDPWFHVTQVNGRRLAEPVVIHRKLTSIEDDGPELQVDDGEEWEIQAFETGRFRGGPDEFSKKKPARQRAVWDHGTGFLSILVGTNKPQAGLVTAPK